MQGFNEEAGRSLKKLTSIIQNEGVRGDVRDEAASLVQEDTHEPIRDRLKSVSEPDSRMQTSRSWTGIQDDNKPEGRTEA